jgi:phage FluMu protein Com
MSNQSGSAFWTCPQCGGMGSVLDSRCPQCGTVRPINPTTTTVTPINTNSPVTAPLTPIVGQVLPINQPQVQQIGQQTCPRCGTINSGSTLACSS